MSGRRSVGVFTALLALCTHAAASDVDVDPWNVTVVSGYWQISSKHSHNDYLRWWGHSLKVNAPYVFFYWNESDRKIVETIRKDEPTIFIQKNLRSPDFSTIHKNVEFSATWTHPVHVPSVELARLWLGKVSLVAEASRLNMYRTNWFAWADAGLAAFRDSDPPPSQWPNPGKLASLPSDKIVYSDSGDREFHDVAGTAFMYHRSIVDKVENEFRTAYENCATEAKSWLCGTDQILFSRMKKANPDFFYQLGTGYGAVVGNLY